MLGGSKLAVPNGPIYAVRRQHQRDAYAALLIVLNAFVNESMMRSALQRVRTEASQAGGPPIDVTDRAHALIADLAGAPIIAANVVMELEGPESVAAAARGATNWAVWIPYIASAEVTAADLSRVRSGAAWRQHRARIMEEEIVSIGVPQSVASADAPVEAAHAELVAATVRFVMAARTELNRRPG